MSSVKAIVADGHQIGMHHLQGTVSFFSVIVPICYALTKCMIRCGYSCLTLLSFGHFFMSTASHTWTHVGMNSLSADALKENVCKLDSALQRILGFAPAIVRPPYGECLDAPYNALTGWGFSVVNWNLDSL